jgi:septum formation protein
VILTLASASPRRAELLTAAGFTFDIAPADIDETPFHGEPADVYALRVARAKAADVAERRDNRGLILAADTVVVAGSRLMGKPVDAADAASMLRTLSGVEHKVLTALVLRTASGAREAIVTTAVTFNQLTAEEIAWYIATGEPVGKAGAYGIQGRAARFIERIDGSWSNVVGLPISTVYRLLVEAGAVSLAGPAGTIDPA